MANSSKPTSKLGLVRQTLKRLDALTSEELARVAGGGHGKPKTRDCPTR